VSLGLIISPTTGKVTVKLLLLLAKRLIKKKAIKTTPITISSGLTLLKRLFLGLVFGSELDSVE
jgi:hypothetical protein